MPAYNLLKFKGFCASGETGTMEKGRTSQENALAVNSENRELRPVPVTSKDSKNRPLVPSTSPASANNPKHRQTADRVLIACPSADRPASVRRKYSPPAPCL